MLRITTLVGKDRITLKLEGKLRGPWNSELVKVWSKLRSAAERKPIEIDLRDVSFLDEQGKILLSTMRQSGAEVLAAEPLTALLSEEILAAGGSSSSGEDNRAANSAGERCNRKGYRRLFRTVAQATGTGAQDGEAHWLRRSG